MSELGPNRYGKRSIRVVTVHREGERHHLRDLTVDLALEGDFQAAHREGDNRQVLPTDTMKNTVYALARRRGPEEMEDFGRALADHFVESVPSVRRATVGLAEHLWQRLETGGEPHPHAFRLPGRERRTATVTRHEEVATVEAGLEDLAVFKTTGSAFTGFRRDPYTTLPEEADRLLATQVSAVWLYQRLDLDFGALWRAVRSTILETFAAHDQSASLQHTAYRMGEEVLDRHEEVRLIRFSLPNLHHLLVDLSPFELDNPGEVFVATPEPYGLIEVTVRR